MFFFPTTLLFMLLQFILHIVVVVFSTMTYLFLKTIRLPENIEEINITSAEYEKGEVVLDDFGIVPGHIYFFHTVNLFGFLWATSFVMGLGRMVLTATFATWYSAKDKKLIPPGIIPNCLTEIVR